MKPKTINIHKNHRFTSKGARGRKTVKRKKSVSGGNKANS